MKVCLVADPHLFSTEIGGNWPEESFIIFKDRILPRIREEKPDILVFLGDVLDPRSGRTDPRWPRGDEVSLRFVKALKKIGMGNVYILRGNHDYPEALRNISEMGGASLVDDDWVREGDTGFYFFSSRYPDLKKAVKDLKAIPQINVKNKILLMHENLSVRGAENIPPEVMEEVSSKFHLVLNGHEHIARRVYDNVWSLSSVLPWRVGSEISHIEIIWEGEKLEKRENENKMGFWVLDTDKLIPVLIPVDPGIKIVIARLYFSGVSALMLKERLKELSQILNKETNPERTIVRVYLKGTLREGDERIDVGFSEIEAKFYANFYEGKSKNILRLEGLRGGGAYLSREDLRYISVEDALKQLEPEIPGVRSFYEEVYDLIEKRTFDGDALLERIKNSKILENIDEI